jgi:hypothetical protein
MVYCSGDTQNRPPWKTLFKCEFSRGVSCRTLADGDDYVNKLISAEFHIERYVFQSHVYNAVSVLRRLHIRYFPTSTATQPPRNNTHLE